MVGTVSDSGGVITATGDWGPGEEFRRNIANKTLVDCTGATFVAQNNSTLPGGRSDYPVLMENANGTCEVRGGSVDGTISQTDDWSKVYGYNPHQAVGSNSASVFLKGCAGQMIVSDWRIENAFDGVRINVPGNAAAEIASNNYIIENIWLTNSRDDAVECDQGQNGIIRNSLFENCFSGISVGDANMTDGVANNLIQVDNVLLKMGIFSYQQTQQQGPPLKVQANKSPQFKITNTIIAVVAPRDLDKNRLNYAFDNLLHPDSANNYFLNMTDGPLDSDYPTNMPPSFTLLEGQTARDYWNTARAAFLEGGSVPNPDPVPTADAGVYHLLTINPTSGAIRIYTDEAYVADATVGITDGTDSATAPVTLTVE